MATADDGGEVKVWDVRPKADDGTLAGQTLRVEPRATLGGLTDAVRALAFTADGRTLVTGGADRVPRLWDAETGQERAALAGHADAILLAAFRTDDAALLTVGREGAVHVWRAAR